MLIVGLILTLFNTAIGVGLSFRIPFTSSNVTAAGSIGEKQKVVGALPAYTAGRLGGNQNFINQSQTLTIGPAEGAAVVVIGAQPGAPVIDLHLVAH